MMMMMIIIIIIIIMITEIVMMVTTTITTTTTIIVVTARRIFVQNVDQPDDVGMIETTQHGDLAVERRKGARVETGKGHFLDGGDAVGGHVAGEPYGREGAGAQLGAESPGTNVPWGGRGEGVPARIPPGVRRGHGGEVGGVVYFVGGEKCFRVSYGSALSRIIPQSSRRTTNA